MGLPGNPAKQGGRVARPQRFRTKQPSCHSNHSCHSCDKKQPPYLRRRRKRLFFVYAAHFLRPPLCWPGLLSPLTPDGTSFNIQNLIPHPSQKEKVLFETHRAKECQRGTAGAEARAKEGGRVPAEGSDTRLGPHSQTFEPHTPDQTLPNRAKEHQTSAKSSGLSLPFFSISCNPKCGNIPKTPTT